MCGFPYLRKRAIKKPFDPTLYNEDDNAKWQVIDWLYSRGFYAWVNPDQYGIDVLAFKDWLDYGFEVEVKHNWQGELFPFGTVHFSARKLKFVGVNTYFTMLNDARTHVLLAHGSTLMESPVVSKRTKYTDDEQFIAVPLSQCVIRVLD
jgi:hypothetical protein